MAQQFHDGTGTVAPHLEDHIIEHALASGARVPFMIAEFDFGNMGISRYMLAEGAAAPAAADATATSHSCVLLAVAG